MRRLSLSILAVLALVAGVLSTSASVAAPPDDHYDVYVGEVASSQVTEIVDLGVDRHDLQLSKISGEKGEKAQVRVEAILSGAQAKQLAKQGVDMSPKKVDGKTAAEQANEQAADGHEVFKKYSGKNGIKAEYEQAAADNPAIAKTVTIGKTVNGQDIIAMKISKDARKVKDGKKPSVLYAGAQHAREWITPEMNRRLMHHVIDNYGSDPKITSAAWTRTSCGSSRWPTRTATTSPSSPTTGCGARTCATTTTTARSLPVTASTSTATTRPSGATTTKDRRPTPAARPTADRRRAPSRRPRR